MAIRETSVKVTGRPALLTSSGAAAESWKTAVWTVVSANWAGGVIAEPCSIDLRFRIGRAFYAQTALANLLKSTIDGLGRALFAHAPSGQSGPWSTEDWWICQLGASKEPVALDPGVAITIGATTPRPATASESLAVVGSPAVWIGSGERVWRTAVTATVLARGETPLPEPLGVHFDFTIEPSRMKSADLDNLCIPSAQAVHDGLFGTYRGGQANRIAAITAEKSASSVAMPPGLRIAFFNADRYRTL